MLRSDLSTVEVGIAGALSGTLARFMAQPLDVLKIRFQLQFGLRDEAKYKSIPQAIRLIIREEGIQGLWKGHVPAQLLSISYGAVQFASFNIIYRFLSKKIEPKTSRSEVIVNIISGSGAGFSATAVTFPLDVLRTHLIYQGEPKIYHGTFDAVIKIYKVKGLKGFSNGLTAASCQIIPLSGLMFGFHHTFTQLWFLFVPPMFSKKHPTLGNLVAGLMSGICAKAVVYPFDLVKKYLQVQNFNGSNCYGDAKILNCRNVFECIKFTIKVQGLAGLFKGFGPSILKSGVTASLYFTLFEESCRMLQYAKGF